MRTIAQAELRRLHNKRKRSASPPPDPAKRTRTTHPPNPAPVDVDDTPIYTLHALSVSSPVRKKLDITIHTKTLRIGNLSFPLRSLNRAFLLPTRGKAKPHWTIVLLSSDVPARPTKGATPSISSDFQVIFGVDAEPSTAVTTTTHPAPAQIHTKGTPARPHLLQFLRRLPVPVFEPSADVFSPVASGGSLGLAAYQGAKEGTLWFMPSGVLGEHKPVEFWPLEDLDTPEGDFEAVRLQSATGRTCSVFVRRRPEGNSECEEGEETEFAMIDGREQDGIRAWVRRYRNAFGKGEATVNDSVVDKGKAKAVDQGSKADVEHVAIDEGDSDSDSNFEVSSGEYDGGSPTSSSSEDEDSEDTREDDASGSDANDEANGGGQDAGDSDDDNEPLEPARSLLLRPGTVPKMSGAVMDMAVGMMMGDLMSRPTAEDGDEEDELVD
ncbi:hypothetical protein K488DRAFT_43055 [Vararia minispora EC-137]|uniref:Uncharacterized protein n=1 Tax=Vararia minispora EC-137 TaxID=1314806 RepID=A0ACB8QUI0_9AGAM|nr:hypothetical protein K488DRAFT_43055 [Vararia minispora EC-137]